MIDTGNNQYNGALNLDPKGTVDLLDEIVSHLKEAVELAKADKKPSKQDRKRWETALEMLRAKGIY